MRHLLELTCLSMLLFSITACGVSSVDTTAAQTNSGAAAEATSDATASDVDASIRDQALAGGLLIIESYFSGDPEAFINLLADELMTLGGPTEWPIGKEEFSYSVRNQLPFPAGLDLSGYTIDDYHATFAPRALSYVEAVEQGLIYEVTGRGWVPADNELIFIGSELQPGLQNADKFLWDSLNVFVVGKHDGIWKLVGFSPDSFPG